MNPMPRLTIRALRVRGVHVPMALPLQTSGGIDRAAGADRPQTDNAGVRQVRRAVGDKATLMCDYNQALSVAEAVRRVRALDDKGLYWIEEPTQVDDYRGDARIRRKARTSSRWARTGGVRTRWPFPRQVQGLHLMRQPRRRAR